MKQTCGIICCGFEKVKLLEEKYLFSNLHEFLFCLHFFTVLLPVHLVCLSHVWKMEASAHTDFTTESLLIRLVLKLNIKHPSISSNSNAAASHSIACLLPVIHETDRSSVHQGLIIYGRDGGWVCARTRPSLFIWMAWPTCHPHCHLCSPGQGESRRYLTLFSQHGSLHPLSPSSFSLPWVTWQLVVSHRKSVGFLPSFGAQGHTWF